MDGAEDQDIDRETQEETEEETQVETQSETPKKSRKKSCGEKTTTVKVDFIPCIFRGGIYSFIYY